LQKIYGAANENETRYSPATCIGCDMKVVSGNPDSKHVSTSFVERQNLSMRMSIRRFTRLTNAFSKKIENHAAAMALWFMYYNYLPCAFGVSKNCAIYFPKIALSAHRLTRGLS
jgi:hypothetical protein